MWLLHDIALTIIRSGPKISQGSSPCFTFYCHRLMPNSQVHLVQEAAASNYSFFWDRVSFFHRGYGSSKSGGLLTTSHSSVDHHTDIRDSDTGIGVTWNLPCSREYSHQAPPVGHKSQDPIFALGCSPQQTFTPIKPFLQQFSIPHPQPRLQRGE